MSVTVESNKKFLDATGLAYLWSKIKSIYKISATDDGQGNVTLTLIEPTNADEEEY